MKYAKLYACLLSFASTAVSAQILPAAGQVITPVAPVIERLPSNLSRLREQVENNAKTKLEKGSLATQTLVSNTISGVTPRFTVPNASTILSVDGEPIIQEISVEDGFIAVEKEWLFMGEESDIDYFNHPAISVLEKQFMSSLSKWLFRVKVEGDTDTVSLIRNSLPEPLQAQVGRNHIYLSQSKREASLPKSANEHRSVNHTQTESTEAEDSHTGYIECDSPLRMGMIDTHITSDHPLFSHIQIEQASFLIEGAEGSSEHGTSVASLMANVLPPGSQLFNANVFYTRNSISRGATLSALLKGINHLASLQVDAINMSLAGPNNPLLMAAITQLDELGIQVIAAVGNEGPASLPLYPAAYQQTLGATAVDSDNRIYRWANQGEYVDFAALGVSVETALPPNKTIRQTGTSMAAPIIAAKYACLLRKNKNRQSALALMQRSAIDAGAPGRDTVFGFGILLR